MTNERVFPDPMRAAESSIINQDPYDLEQGLTIRQYMAAKALQGIMGNPNTAPTTQVHFDNIAEDAIRAADTLIEKLYQK